MGQVNIYIIAENKRPHFVRELSEKLQELGTLRIEREIQDSNLEESKGEISEVNEGVGADKGKPEKIKEVFNLTLYTSTTQEPPLLG